MAVRGKGGGGVSTVPELLLVVEGVGHLEAIFHGFEERVRGALRRGRQRGIDCCVVKLSRKIAEALRTVRYGTYLCVLGRWRIS